MIKGRKKKLKIRIKTGAKVSKVDNIDNDVILDKKAKENEENEKIMLMRVGVVCVMVIFFVAWFVNLKYQFKINSNNESKSSIDWEQTKAELDKAMSQVKNGINEIKKIQTTKEQNALPLEPELTAEQINLLKGKLLSETATGTIATSTKINVK